jgi:hypothetical protein
LTDFMHLNAKKSEHFIGIFGTSTDSRFQNTVKCPSGIQHTTIL